MNQPVGPRPTSHTKTPRRFGRRGAAAVASLALLMGGVGAVAAATQVTEKNPGRLIAVGPVSGDNGSPAGYEDSTHLRVELSLAEAVPLCGRLPGDVPSQDEPISFPDN